MAETLDELRAAVKVRRDGSVVMRKGGRVIGILHQTRVFGITSSAWTHSKARASHSDWWTDRAAALDALLRAHLEHEHG